MILGGTSPSSYFWGDLPDLEAPLVEVIIDEGEHNWAFMGKVLLVQSDLSTCIL